MRELTSSSGLRSKWLEQLLSTTPSDRPRAEAAVRRLYSAAGLREPAFDLWGLLIKAFQATVLVATVYLFSERARWTRPEQNLKEGAV